jgi:hypothetical protein
MRRLKTEKKHVRYQKKIPPKQREQNEKRILPQPEFESTTKQNEVTRKHAAKKTKKKQKNVLAAGSAWWP